MPFLDGTGKINFRDLFGARLSRLTQDGNLGSWSRGSDQAERGEMSDVG